MFPSQNRRDFLRVVAGLPLARLAFPQASLTTTKLTDNISLISGAGSNVLVLTTPDGVLMVDGGAPEHSADLLKLAGGPVRVLFNTHWHLDHTGSNEAIAKAGARI